QFKAKFLLKIAKIFLFIEIERFIQQSFNDKVLFDKSIKAEPNNISIIKNYQDEYNIVLLKKISTKELVGVYINPKYNDLVIDIKEIVAIGVEARKPSRKLVG
ncbi:hypothetical protein, partial [Francisella sp. 19S2-4]|uniref:hypothetical protein n=1 Tax=Francisella sp. 19S2-4 TaxID=3088361 RepID=UPI002E347589